jgi:hypothetical protein
MLAEIHKLGLKFTGKETIRGMGLSIKKVMDEGAELGKLEVYKGGKLSFSFNYDTGEVIEKYFKKNNKLTNDELLIVINTLRFNKINKILQKFK